MTPNRINYKGVEYVRVGYSLSEQPYFWHFDYRHHMFNSTPEQQKSVKDALTSQGLPLGGSSPEHMKIIQNVIGKKSHPDATTEHRPLEPDQYHKEYDKCPPGWNWDGRHCKEAED